MMRTRRVACGAVWALAPVAVAAAGMHDALQPAGPQAGHVHALWLLMLAVCTFVFVAVIGALLIGIARARRGDERTPADVAGLVRDERGLRRSVGAAVGISIALLGALFAATVVTDRALARLPVADALHIKLTGHQWWWEAMYDDPTASNMFSTANELHIPVGRPVLLTLEASDVIHSVWFPDLAGKKDLIPGRTATLALRADQPGLYRGQCAEFCGYQHAKMVLYVIAEPAAQYEQWAAHSRASAPPPANDLTRRGQQVFMQSTCAMCHAISGTIASGQQAPDLTHVASRQTLAAGTLPNTPSALSAWISDPQLAKPGANMPPNGLPPADLQALVAYLGTLQ
jgi:cytochrome c oxidase subunit II